MSTESEFDFPCSASWRDFYSHRHGGERLPDWQPEALSAEDIYVSQAKRIWAEQAANPAPTTHSKEKKEEIAKPIGTAYGKGYHPPLSEIFDDIEWN